MLPLAAYADRLSVRPGETVRFQVANSTGIPVDARLVRVISADANPAGPGIRLETLQQTPVKLLEPGPGAVPRGSFARVPGVEQWLNGNSFTLLCRVFPTRHGPGEQALLALMDDDANRGVALMLDPDGRLQAVLGDGTGLEGSCVERRLRERQWSLAWLSFDVDTRRLQAGYLALSSAAGDATTPCMSEHVAVPDAAPLVRGPLLMAAACDRAPRAHFNGKLERPQLVARALGRDELLAIARGEVLSDLVADWDFALEVQSQRIVDTGPNGLDGRLVNTPARAMTGSSWCGAEMCFRHAPGAFGAIHFHDDDIDDCRWPAAFEWTVPAGTRSAAYALVLDAGGVSENVPFYVVPARGRPGAPLAVLASTFTYTVYGNHARPEWDNEPGWQAAWREQSTRWQSYPHNPAEHREYGLSTYNWHSDRSGISVASWHRPLLNMRIAYITYPDEAIRGSGLRHFPADSHLLAWLEHQGHAYDVVTDFELHHEGAALLAGYRAVLTSSHPEYHSPAMLDAIEAYRDTGGRLCYLGGNGFYWKIALCPERAGVIEIRRAEGGIRAWAAEPGEYYNQFDGQYGGMWRRNGRPPQKLCGVGFTAQGNFSGSYYRKRPMALDSRAAWVFDGIDGETFGDHGLSAHGAAGFELDRADHRLGTPQHALVVASSENHPPETPWVLVPEEILTHLTNWPGQPVGSLIRADMVFFETPGGGAVFSTGSITFCGSLVSNGFENDVSRLLDNVVRRFLDPAPFEMPPG